MTRVALIASAPDNLFKRRLEDRRCGGSVVVVCRDRGGGIFGGRAGQVRPGTSKVWRCFETECAAQSVQEERFFVPQRLHDSMEHCIRLFTDCVPLFIN